jgi:hypothetical protein
MSSDDVRLKWAAAISDAAALPNQSKDAAVPAQVFRQLYDNDEIPWPILRIFTQLRQATPAVPDCISFGARPAHPTAKPQRPQPKSSDLGDFGGTYAEFHANGDGCDGTPRFEMIELIDMAQALTYILLSQATPL